MAALWWFLGPRPRSHTLHSEAAVLVPSAGPVCGSEDMEKRPGSVGGHPVFLLDRGLAPSSPPSP